MCTEGSGDHSRHSVAQGQIQSENQEEAVVVEGTFLFKYYINANPRIPMHAGSDERSSYIQNLGKST